MEPEEPQKPVEEGVRAAHLVFAQMVELTAVVVAPMCLADKIHQALLVLSVSFGPDVPVHSRLLAQEIFN